MLTLAGLLARCPAELAATLSRFPWGWVIVVLVIGASITGFVFYMLKKRRDDLKALGDEMGFTYKRRADELLNAPYSRFTGFSGMGRPIARREARNALVGKLEDLDVRVFDYYSLQKVRSASSNTSGSTHTVIAVRVPGMSLPHFFLGKENFLSRIAESMGLGDIDFEDWPVFSGRYHLGGQDEQAIRGFFQPEVIRFFEQLQEDFGCEGGGEWLTHNCSNRLAKVSELPHKIQMTAQVAMFLNRQAKQQAVGR